MWVWISAAGDGVTVLIQSAYGGGGLRDMATNTGLRPAHEEDGCLPPTGSLCLFNSPSVFSETLAALTAVTSLNCQPQIN